MDHSNLPLRWLWIINDVHPFCAMIKIAIVVLKESRKRPVEIAQCLKVLSKKIKILFRHVTRLASLRTPESISGPKNCFKQTILFQKINNFDNFVRLMANLQVPCNLWNIPLPITRSEVQMETGDDFLNVHFIINWSPSHQCFRFFPVRLEPCRRLSKLLIIRDLLGKLTNFYVIFLAMRFISSNDAIWIMCKLGPSSIMNFGTGN